MKRTFLLVICVALIGIIYATGNENLVIIGFGYRQGDNQSRGAVNNVTKQLSPALGNDDHFKLIPEKDVSNTIKALKITTTPDALTSEQASLIGERHNASIIVWGTIEPNTAAGNTMFRIRGNMLSQRSGTLSTFTTPFQNKREQIVNALKNDLLPTIKNFSKGEIQKLFDIAYQQYTSKNYETAEAGFQDILKMDQRNTDAYYYLGYMQYEQDNYERAIDYYNQGLQIDPTNETLLRYLSVSYERNDMLNEALAALEKIAEQNPDKAIYYNVARLYNRLGKTSEALSTLDKAFEIDPDFESAHDLYAEIAYDKQDFNAAIKSLEFLSNARPDNDEIARRLALCYQRTNQLDKAIDSYRTIIAGDANNLRAYLNLASAYRTKALDNPAEARNNYDKARLTYIEAMKISPNNPRIEVSLADVYLALGDRSNARRYAESAKQKDPTVYEASAILADITQREGIEKYNAFIAIQREISTGENAGTLWGDVLNQKYTQRNTTRTEANNLFTRADRLYRDALANATDRARADLSSKIATNRQYIDQTKAE